MTFLDAPHLRLFVAGLAAAVIALAVLVTLDARNRLPYATGADLPVQVNSGLREPGAVDVASATPAPVEPTAIDGQSRLVSASRSASRPREAARAAPTQFTIITVPRDLPIRERPGAGRVIGTMPTRSKYLATPIRAWLIERRGRFGRVVVPWSGSTTRTGWISTTGLATTTTGVMARVSLSRREITVLRAGRIVLRVPAAIGAAVSPSPRGRYFVTDRVDIGSSAPSFGSYAFGLSGIQTRLPPGWTGKDQMAVHGTNDPASIGTAASAGCLRVSESSLARLRSLLRLGTPVVIGR